MSEMQARLEAGDFEGLERYLALTISRLDAVGVQDGVAILRATFGVRGKFRPVWTRLLLSVNRVLIDLHGQERAREMTQGLWSMR